MLFHIVICWLNKHKIIQRYYKRRCFKFDSVKAKKSPIIFFEKNLRVFSSMKKRTRKFLGFIYRYFTIANRWSFYISATVYDVRKDYVGIQT